MIYYVLLSKTEQLLDGKAPSIQHCTTGINQKCHLALKKLGKRILETEIVAAKVPDPTSGPGQMFLETSSSSSPDEATLVSHISVKKKKKEA